MPNLPKTLTTHELEEVEAMAGLGLRFEDIANIKGMSDETLRKYAKDHLIARKSQGKSAGHADGLQTGDLWESPRHDDVLAEDTGGLAGESG